MNDDDNSETPEFRNFNGAAYVDIAQVSPGPPKVLGNYAYKLDFDTDEDRGLRWVVSAPGGAIASGWAVNMHAMGQAVEVIINELRVRDAQLPLPTGAEVFTIGSSEPEPT